MNRGKLLKGNTRYTYRGVGFEHTRTGYWVFDERPPRHGHWSRFFTQEEMKQEIETGGTVVDMHRAIDRALGGRVIYTGDLRDQHNSRP